MPRISGDADDRARSVEQCDQVARKGRHEWAIADLFTGADRPIDPMAEAASPARVGDYFLSCSNPGRVSKTFPFGRRRSFWRTSIWLTPRPSVILPSSDLLGCRKSRLDVVTVCRNFPNWNHAPRRGLIDVHIWEVFDEQAFILGHGRCRHNRDFGVRAIFSEHVEFESARYATA